MELKSNEFVVRVIGMDDFQKGGKPFQICIDLTDRDLKAIDESSLTALDGVIAHGCLNSSWVFEWYKDTPWVKKELKGDK